jgi:putative ABC transport system permease protein
MIARLFASLRGLLRRRQIDGEIAEELRDHLEHEIEVHRSRGASPEDARRLALRDLGGLTQTIESTRAVRATWLDAVWRDVGYAVRVLRRSPRFTITALTTLVVGIGATTAIFSVAYAVLVRPLPYPDADRLVFVAEKESAGVAWPNFEDWRRRATSFDGLASSLADAVIVTDGQIPRRFESRSVTSNFFRVLGVSSLSGRLFDDADARPDAAATAVVSHAFWVRELGGAPDAIGRTVSLNRKPFTVIGVLPPGFRYMTQADVYLLLEPQIAANYRGMQSRNTHTTLFALGRLKPGVTDSAARMEMRAIAATLARDYKQADGIELVALDARIVGDMAPTLRVLTGAVTLLLLIACVNLAILQLNRGASRARELSIRAAVGASRWNLIRQLLIEQTVLVVTGGVLGGLAGAVILRGLVMLAPRDVPRLEEIGVDPVVLGWATLFSCGCAFLCGVVPAFRAAGAGGQALVIRSARGMTRSAARLRRGLTMAEIALAMVLLSGSGLMVHSMLRLGRVDPGFDPRNLQTFMFSLTGPGWPDARKQVFYDDVVGRLRAVPGVEDAALSYSLPILGSNWWSMFMLNGTTAEHWIAVGTFPNAGIVPVTTRYFETLRIPVLEGRSFDRSDTPDSMPVAIVTGAVARKYWPGGDAIGKQIRLGVPEPYGPWRTIVGVAGDIKQHGVDQETPPQVFLPIVQQPRTTVFAIARTRSPMPSTSLEAALHDLDPLVPVFNDRTVDQVMREASGRRRIAMVVLSVFAGVAVLLAAIGLYGVIAQGVAERRQEIGVRMALGATRTQIAGLFLRQGLVVVAVGIGCGIVAARAAGQSLASLVFGVTVTDPATMSAVAAFLTVAALLACGLPARSATRVDPLEALRLE